MAAQNQFVAVESFLVDESFEANEIVGLDEGLLETLTYIHEDKDTLWLRPIRITVELITDADIERRKG